MEAFFFIFMFGLDWKRNAAINNGRVCKGGTTINETSHSFVFIPNETLLCRGASANETLLSMASAPNETRVSMDLISNETLLLTTTDASGNETLLSIVDVSAKEALLSTRQHIVFVLIPNETLLSMDVSPNETLRSMDSASNETC